MLKHINSIEYFYFQIGGYFEGNRQIIIKDNYFIPAAQLLAKGNKKLLKNSK